MTILGRLVGIMERIADALERAYPPKPAMSSTRKFDERDLTTYNPEADFLRERIDEVRQEAGQPLLTDAEFERIYHPERREAP